MIKIRRELRDLDIPTSQLAEDLRNHYQYSDVIDFKKILLALVFLCQKVESLERAYGEINEKPKKQKAKPVYGWAVVSPDGEILDTISEASEQAIARYLVLYIGPGKSFSNYKKLGYRCVKVKIEEV